MQTEMRGEVTKPTAKLKDYFLKLTKISQQKTGHCIQLINNLLLSSASVLCFVMQCVGSSYLPETLAIISFYHFIAHLVHQQLSPETVF